MILTTNTPSVLQQFRNGNPELNQQLNGDTPEPSSSVNLTPQQMNRQFGAFGNNIFKGFVNGEEYNPELSGHAGLAIYDEMWRSDAAVQASLELMMEPIKGADYDIEPASDDIEHQIQAAFSRYNLFQVIKWKYFIEEALECLPFGHSVFEKIYDWIYWEGTTVVMPDGNMSEEKMGAGWYKGIVSLDSRRQDSIFAWEQTDGTPGIQQNTPTGGSFDIPASKLVVFTHRRRGNNFTGISVLRSSYKNWYIKSGLEKGMAIAAERQGVGVPYFEAPVGAIEDDLRKARTAMRNLRVNEQAYLEMPSGWNYGFLDMKANSTLDPMPQINYHNRQILLNVLGQHLDQGSSGASGSRASSQTHNSILDQSLEGIIAVDLEDPINENIIKQLVGMNWTTDQYPRIKHSQLNDTAPTTLPDALQKLSNAGLITADPELEERLRTMFKLPDLPDDIKEDYANRNQSGSIDPKTGLPVVTGKAPIVADKAAKAPATPSEDDDDDEDIEAADALSRARSAKLQLIQAADKLYASHS